MQVLVVATINASGYGLQALNTMKALESAGHEVVLFPRLLSVGGFDLRATPAEAALVRQALRRQDAHDPMAPCLAIVSEDAMSLFAGRGVRAGYVALDTDALTDGERHRLRQLDVLFVASAWARDVAVASGLDPGKVRVAPEGVDTTVFHPGVAEPPVDRTVFVHVGKWERRKGQDVIVEAFGRAFGAGDDVVLRLLSSNPLARRDGDWQQWCREQPLGERIELLAPQPAVADVARTIAGGHCGVYPSRAEGWNLPLLETLACGRHAIATDYGGPTTYLTAENARLVPIDGMEPAEDRDWNPLIGTRKAGRWARLAEGAIASVAQHMRDVHAARLAGELGVNDAGVRTAARFPWSRTAAAIVEGLQQTSDDVR